MRANAAIRTFATSGRANETGAYQDNVYGRPGHGTDARPSGWYGFWIVCGMIRGFGIRMLAGVVVYAYVAGASAQSSATGAALFVLGDSLSDTGNLAALADYALNEPFHPQFTVGLCHPADIYFSFSSRGCDDVLYRRSRVTNGPVAVEVLAAQTGAAQLVPSFHLIPERPAVGTNYAVAGATARGDGLGDLAAQIDFLQIDHGPRLSGTALFVMMIGGNDALDILRTAARASNGGGSSLTSAEHALAGGAEETLSATADAISDAATRLIDYGARRLVVANLPPLADVPVVRARAEKEGLTPADAAALADEVVRVFNEALAARVATLEAEHPEAVIRLFDLYSLFESELAAAARAGHNVTEACFDSERYRESSLGERVFAPGCAPETDGPPRFDRFFFWDGLHPTATVHAAAGRALAAIAPEAGVGPASAPRASETVGKTRHRRLYSRPAE